MKLFKHYKGKYYGLINIAKHSETLEELVVYNTRYDSPGGRLWVRPKTMFFESVEIEGSIQPRFAEVEITIHQTDSVDVNLIGELMTKVFGAFDCDVFLRTLQTHSRFCFFTAFAEGVCVGFKLGYERRRDEFYSWLGGVVPELRGCGIARRLLEAQHGWCREQGYKTVHTRCQNEYPEMLLLNLKAGFKIVGTQWEPSSRSESGQLKILMSKFLL